MNVTTIGGGTGSVNILMGLKKIPGLNLAAIVNVADSGGSTGELRDQFGILPPGDIRRAIAALAKNTEVVRRLFEHRFARESRVKGHTIGNLLLTGLTEMTGNFEEAIDILSEMFDIEGKVIPVTLDDSHLQVILEDGSVITGETNIDIPKHNPHLRIIEASLTSPSSINRRALEAIENSDYIILGPWDLYTSIVPNLLVKGVKEAISKSKAKIIYVCNIMTKHGETTGFNATDFVEILEKYLGEGIIDSIVLNNGEISPEIADKYLKTEWKIPVARDMLGRLRDKGYRVIERDLTSESDFARHDPKKFMRVFLDFMKGWIQ
jgi:uncharacterized cofD-like protein